MTTSTRSSSGGSLASAVGSMALCVALLIASEFMPVSLLTPIAGDLHATQGMAGQAISISGLFAVLASLFIGPIAGRFDRRYVLMSMTVLMLLSLILIALAPSFLANGRPRTAGFGRGRFLVAGYRHGDPPGSCAPGPQRARHHLHG